MPTFYEIIGVSSSASKKEINAAYRKRALALHPDRPGGDALKFQQLSRIHNVLIDPAKRATYDRFGAEEPSTADMFSTTVALLPWLAVGAVTGIAMSMWRSLILSVAPVFLCVFLVSGNDASATRRQSAARADYIAFAYFSGFLMTLGLTWFARWALAYLTYVSRRLWQTIV